MRTALAYPPRAWRSKPTPPVQYEREPSATPGLAECGAPADQLIILNSGTAKIYLLAGRKKVPLGIAGPGTVFGLSSMLAETPLDRGLTSLEPCEVTILPKKAFLDALNRNQHMYFAIVKLLSADLAGADRIIRSHIRAANGKAQPNLWMRAT